MPSFIICCTCAAARGSGTPHIDEKTEKPVHDVQLSCCGRTICARCIDVSKTLFRMDHADQMQSNPRFATYCPFCQKLRLQRGPSLSEASASEPPPYTASDPEVLDTIPRRTPPPPPQPSHVELAQPDHPPPSYTAAPAPLPAPLPALSSSDIQQSGILAGRGQVATAEASPDDDVIHFLHPSDTLPSLSLAYRVPLPVLRSHNHLHSDHLLSARRKIKVPRSHYKGGSLSPQPVEGEEESERKARLRRFMVRCKCADYKIATLYLEDHAWDLDKAVEKWGEDERWEKENPMPKGKVFGSNWR